MTAAIGAALLLITRTVDPKRVYAEIYWGLLVFFVGLFVIVAGVDRAGLTARLLEPVNHWTFIDSAYSCLSPLFSPTS